MKKIFAFLLSLIITIASVTIVSQEVFAADNLTVTFDLNGGKGNISEQIIEKGKKAIYPSIIPKKEGYEFNTWFFNGEAFNFFSTPIKEDIKLKADYVKIDENAKFYYIRFETAGGGPRPENQVIEAGELVYYPDIVPSKENYEFIGWYDSKGEYDFDLPVQRDMVLFAKYDKNGETHEKSRRKDINIKDEDYDLAIINYDEAFFSGYPDGTFKPDEDISRAEMSTVLCNVLDLADLEPQNTTRFSDIDGHWAKNNILKLAECGLLSGYPDGTFKPDSKMTRAEITVIINRYWEIEGFNPNTDKADIYDIKNHWAEKLILSLYNHNIVDLNIDFSFKPDEPLKRAVVSQILNRITDRPLINLNEQSFTDLAPGHWAYMEISAASSKAKKY